ncbi:MAG TPA: hypothetical protein VFX59_07345 [Polyangiales bacterium]|nr:hypothetical protein [Polyangiales bacterium]
MSLHQTLACVALAALGACSDPSYRMPADDGVEGDAGDASTFPLRNDDAGSGRDAAKTPTDSAVTPPARDAEVADAKVDEPDAEDVGPRTLIVPPWAERMLGPYASRASLFRQDEYGTITRGTLIRLHQFVVAEGGLVVRSKLCQYRASTTLAEITLLDPTGAPEQTQNVLFSDVEERWSTDGPPVQYGFTRALPKVCEGKVGESVNKPATQVWNTSAKCRCPEVDEEPLLDDCRLLDPDQDGHPGFTFHLMGTALIGEADVFGGYESASQAVNGQLRADGTMRANVRAADANYQFDCQPAGCTNIAVLGKWCPSSINTIDFVPLTDAAPSCESVVAELGTLFPSAIADYPPRCFQ